MTGKYVLVQCPHCTNYVQVYQKDFNCRIFRHGILKSNIEQINPHSSKKVCDELSEKNLIYGCGKPFELVNVAGTEIAKVCDYI